MAMFGKAFSKGYKGVGKYAGDKAIKWLKGEGPLLDIHDYFPPDTENYRDYESRWREERRVQGQDKEAYEKRVDAAKPIIEQYSNQLTEDQVDRLRKLYMMGKGGGM